MEKADQGKYGPRNLKRMNVWEERWGETGKQQWNKDPRLKEAATSEEREDIGQDLLENHLAGDCEGNSWIFHLDSENEYQDIMDGPASSELEKETAHRLRVRALTILRTFSPTDQKSRMMVKNLD
jgi:hypothetical protein